MKDNEKRSYNVCGSGASDVERNNKGFNRVKPGMSVSKVKVTLNKSTGKYMLLLPALCCCIGEFLLPKDNQFVLDAATMEKIANALSQRYKIGKSETKESSACATFHENNVYENIGFWQVGPSRYEFYLPNGICIGEIITPDDWCLKRDAIVIKEVCKALANRFDLI